MAITIGITIVGGFTSTRHWDEVSTGTWTLRVSDRALSKIGTLNFWELNIYGDTLRGVATNNADTLFGKSVGDFIDGLDGNDTLDGRLGNDILEGGAGNDVLNGGSGFDTLIGVDSSSLSPGAKEQDTIIGGKGTLQANTIVLGNRSDVFYSSAGALDFALIRDFKLSGTNQDLIQLRGSARDYSLAASRRDTNLLFGNELIAIFEKY